MNLNLIVFLNCICIGIITSFVNDLTYGIKIFCSKFIVLHLVLDFLIFFLGGTMVFVLANKMFFGVFAVFQILGFLIGVLVEKISCSNLVAKFFNIIYNKFTNLKEKLKQTKIGMKILK